MMKVAYEMGKECENGNQNVYFQARKTASSYNPKLYSREGASELLGVSVSTLADYELGNTKVVPVDKVVLMADLYNCPELKNGYCKHECPIGKTMPIATKQDSIERVALRILKELDTDSIAVMLKTVVSVSAGGNVGNEDMDEIDRISKKMENIQQAISEFQLIAEKLRGGKDDSRQDDGDS